MVLLSQEFELIPKYPLNPKVEKEETVIEKNCVYEAWNWWFETTDFDESKLLEWIGWYCFLVLGENERNYTLFTAVIGIKI